MSQEINDSDLHAAVHFIASITQHEPRAAGLQRLPEKIADVYDAIQQARALIQGRVAQRAAGL